MNPLLLWLFLFPTRWCQCWAKWWLQSIWNSCPKQTHLYSRHQWAFPPLPLYRLQGPLQEQRQEDLHVPWGLEEPAFLETVVGGQDAAAGRPVCQHGSMSHGRGEWVEGILNPALHRKGSYHDTHDTLFLHEGLSLEEYTARSCCSTQNLRPFQSWDQNPRGALSFCFSATVFSPPLPGSQLHLLRCLLCTGGTQSFRLLH